MIEFESVGKTFRDGTAAVVDLTLTVPSQKITVIVGPSGSGKSTTLQMVNRMLEPTSGQITWDGAALKSKRKTAVRRQMGFVIQNGGLFPHRTVVENIGTVPGLLGWSKTKTQTRGLELLGRVGLDRKLAHRYPAQLSGGQQQRVAVARALAADPLVMLMDEPFSGVDPVDRSELHDFFLGLQREISKTVILVTQDVDEAIKLGDQVAILRADGTLAQIGTPQQLLDEPANTFVEGFVGRDRGYRSLSFLSASGLALERVKVVRDAESVTGQGPTLVVDAGAKPVGWADHEHPGQVFPLGSTFAPDSDTLRVSLDSALTSPYGLAVAIESGTGRFAGVVAARDILEQVRDARVAAADSVTMPDTTPSVEDAPPVEEDAPAEVQGPVVEKSADEKPVVEGPVDDKPVVEGPVDDKPVVEGPVDDKPADQEPVEAKPVADATAVEKQPAGEEPAVDVAQDPPPMEEDFAADAPATTDTPAATDVPATPDEPAAPVEPATHAPVAEADRGEEAAEQTIVLRRGPLPEGGATGDREPSVGR